MLPLANINKCVLIVISKFQNLPQGHSKSYQSSRYTAYAFPSLQRTNVHNTPYSMFKEE